VRYLFVLLATAALLSSLLPDVLARNEAISEHEYHNDPFTVLLFTFLMSYATMAILVSLFTFKFASKRSRFLAVPMLASGILPWGIWVVFKLVLRAEYPDDSLFGVVHWAAAPLLLPVMALLGFAFGLGLGLFIFLTIIVRS
jgi:predicted neutral ceramidase superfamily lipid hydrolase